MKVNDFLIQFQTAAKPVLCREKHSYKQHYFGPSYFYISSPADGALFKLVQETKDWSFWLFGKLQGNPTFNDYSEFISSPEKLNGHCLLLAFQKSAKQWHVWTNRLGTIHAYYAFDGKRAALGTFFPAVAESASRKKLDQLAVISFFKYGFFLDDKTYFEDVKILKPATHYIFSEAGGLLKEDVYWKWEQKLDYKRSYEDTIAQFTENFHEVVHDYALERGTTVSVSGGLDSRMISAALAFIPQDIVSKLSFYSYGYSKDSIEMQIAEEITKALKGRLKRYTITPYLFERLNLVLSATEGFQDVTQCRQAAVADQMSDIENIITGHGGNLFLENSGFNPEAGLSTQSIAAFLMKNFKKPSDWFAVNLRMECSHADVEQLFYEQITKEKKRFESNDEADFYIKSFKMRQYYFRFTNVGLRMFLPFAFPKSPFFDNRIVDLVATIPGNLLKNKKLKIEYLKRFSPEMARIKWQGYDADLYHYQNHKTWELPKRILKKAAAILLNKKTISRNWEAQFLNNKGRAGLEYWLLRKGLKVHDFISPFKIKEKVEQLYKKPDAEKGYAISMLLTFSSWMEKWA